MKHLVFLGAALLTIRGAAVGSIIDDKSDFVGDFTVIDFETSPIGYLIDLDPGEFMWIPEDGYAELGLLLSVGNHNEGPFVGNPDSAQHDAALAIVGSPENVLFTEPLFGGHVPGFIRFDFTIPVNAVGLAVTNPTGYGPVRLEVYNSQDHLVEGVDFAGPLVDGAIDGDAFGNPYNYEYGFFGVYTAHPDIEYAIVTEDAVYFDDLHFGIIPEPGTLVLLVAAVGVAAHAQRRIVE